MWLLSLKNEKLKDFGSAVLRKIFGYTTVGGRLRI
jgi:hypothetical protein